MRERSRTFIGGMLVVVMVVLGALGLSALRMVEAHAAEVRPDVTITDFRITSLTQEPMDSIFYSDEFFLKMAWDASMYGSNLHTGDWFDITLPDTMRFPDAGASAFDILSPDGNVVAKGVVTPGDPAGGTLRVTFTDYVEGRNGIKGTVWLRSRFVRTLVDLDEENTVTITVNGEVSSTTIHIVGPKVLENEVVAKWGQLESDGTVRWTARINHVKGDWTGFTLHDELRAGTGTLDGVHYITDSFILEEVEMNEYGGTVRVISSENVSDSVSFSEDGHSFDLDLGDISGRQFVLRYQTTINKGQTLRNSLTAHCNELDATHYSSFTETSSGGSGSGDRITHLDVFKYWDDHDDYDGIRPRSVTVLLFAGTDPVLDENGNQLSAVLNERNDWHATFADLPRYDGNDVEISYSVQESDVPGYEASYVYTDATAVRITNSHQPLRSISITKVWDDADNQDGIRPDELSIPLTADGVTLFTVFLNEGNDWTFTAVDLPVFDPSDGHEISYGISEDSIEGYSIESIAGTQDTGFTITNRHVPEIVDLLIEKVWDDEDDRDGIRPDGIVVTVLANGEPTDHVLTLNAGNEWSAYIPELPKYENGQEIVYTVEETGVEGYSTSIVYHRPEDIPVAIVASVINRHVPDPTPPSPPTPPTPRPKPPTPSSPKTPQVLPRTGDPAPEAPMAFLLTCAALLVAAGLVGRGKVSDS